MNTWAVITGATDGIGLAYAKYLGAQGYNLLLISRNQQKLETIREGMYTECEYERNVRILAIDFKSSDQNIYDKIESEFENLDEIHVLVNNVGICYPNERPEYLTRIPNLNQFIMDLISVNIIACTRLTAMVLPRMEKRGIGIILNLSSFSALYPMPLLSLYSATKAYIDYMSRGLQEEYRHKGIIIQSIMPYYVSTQMAHNKKPSLSVPTADQFVKQAMKTIGREDITTGYCLHSYLRKYTFILNLLIGDNLNQKMHFNRLKGIRNRIRNKEK